MPTLDGATRKQAWAGDQWPPETVGEGATEELILDGIVKNWWKLEVNRSTASMRGHLRGHKDEDNTKRYVAVELEPIKGARGRIVCASGTPSNIVTDVVTVPMRYFVQAIDPDHSGFLQNAFPSDGRVVVWAPSTLIAQLRAATAGADQREVPLAVGDQIRCVTLPSALCCTSLELVSASQLRTGTSAMHGTTNLYGSGAVGVDGEGGLADRVAAVRNAQQAQGNIIGFQPSGYVDTGVQEVADEEWD